MADDNKIVEKKEEKKDPTIGQEVRSKTFTQLISEARQEASKPADETPAETPKDDKPSDEEKQKQEAEAAEKARKDAEKAEAKRQDAIAKKAADEIAARAKAQEEAWQKAEADKKKAEEDAKRREEELKPKFTGVDAKTGQVVPKSYDELVAEGARIGEEKALERFRQEQAAKEAKQAQETEEQKKQTEAVEARKKAFQDELQTEMDNDLNDLWTRGLLTKMKDPNDPNDPGVKDKEALFKKAVEINAARIKEGKGPIRSIKLIYYDYYQPDRAKAQAQAKQPAGHDAPVMGKESTNTNTPPDDKYVVARDRHKSMAQLIREESQRLAKKALNVRSN